MQRPTCASLLTAEAAPQAIAGWRNALPEERSLIVGISGIDASGKSHLSRQWRTALTAMGLRTRVTSIDDWQHPPEVIYSEVDPGGHFNRHGFRFGDLLNAEVRPRRTGQMKDVEVLLVEGIFLFQEGVAEAFDQRIWVECSFEKGMERAVARSQEGLGPEETVRAYEKTYYPAQRVHFERDKPWEKAHWVVRNG